METSRRTANGRSLSWKENIVDEQNSKRSAPVKQKKQSKRKCYEDESEGIRDEVDVVFVAKVSVERYGVLHGVETCNRGTSC